MAGASHCRWHFETLHRKRPCPCPGLSRTGLVAVVNDVRPLIPKHNPFSVVLPRDGIQRCTSGMSTDQQDLTAQQHALLALGVSPERIYVDHGLTGTNRQRPGLQNALAAGRNTDTLVVTKLDRLARSLPDARDIVDELTARNACLQIGASLHDPTDPVGRLLFNVLAMSAEFHGDVIRATNEGGDADREGKGTPEGQETETQPLGVDIRAAGAVLVAVRSGGEPRRVHLIQRHLARPPALCRARALRGL